MRYDAVVDVTLIVRCTISLLADDEKEAHSMAEDWVKEDIETILMYDACIDSEIDAVNIVDIDVKECIPSTM